MGTDIRGFKIDIASPCTVEWSSMTGTERVRFCGLCHKSVYELSGLTRAEVLALLEAKPDACVSFFQREDGTVLTADCPVGERVTRLARRLAWTAKAIVVGVGSVAATGLLALCGVVLVNQTESIAERVVRYASESPRKESGMKGAQLLMPPERDSPPDLLRR